MLKKYGPCKVWNSPLEGKTLPDSWSSLTLDGKRAMMVARGWAADFSDACSLLSKHGHAVKEMRARLAIRKAFAQ